MELNEKDKNELKKLREKYEDRILKFGFELQFEEKDKEYYSLQYGINDGKYFILAHIFKNIDDGKEWANLMFFKPEHKMFDYLTIDEMFKILEEWYNEQWRIGKT